MSLGLDLGVSHHHPVLRPCLDWTERRDHLAGPLGDRLTRHLPVRDLLRRRTGSRAVVLTAAGAALLTPAIGSDPTVADAPECC